MIAPRANNQEKQPARSKETSRVFIYGGLGLVAIAAICAAIVLIDNSEEKSEASREKKPDRITKMSPSAPIERKEEPSELWITNRRGEIVRKVDEKTYIDEKGVLRYEGGARVYKNKDKRVAINVAPHDNMPNFNHRSEYEIATLLTVQPGQSLHGRREYDEAFKQDFTASLLEPIQYDESDDEQARELKAAVEEQKHDLAQRVKDGEDLGTILTEARAELQRLASYKRDVQRLIVEQLRDAENSDEDIEDVVQAANMMLENQGIEPIKAGGLLRGRLRLLQVEERRKQQEAAQHEKQ